MPSRTGSVSYARFRLSGNVPTRVDTDLLDALEADVLRPSEVGSTAEVQSGWTAGRHVFDETFGDGQCVVGETLLVGMRIDVNKVPSDLRKAYRAMAEADLAAASPTGFIGRQERQAAREQAEERCRTELVEGRHRKSKHVPILWDVPRRLILAPAMSEVATSSLAALFRNTFDGSIEPLTSGNLAAEFLASRTRDLEDLEPTAFTSPPADAARDDEGDVQTRPVIPWRHGGPESKDFLGNEFLVWLWWKIDESGGVIETSAGPIGAIIDRVLHADCGWDVTGKMTLQASGPTHLPEARTALKTGKWPRKAGLVLASRGDQWTMTLQSDRFIVSGAKLPAPEDPPGSAREAIEQRLSSIEAMDETLERLYRAFIDERADASKWSGVRSRIIEWIKTPGAARRVVHEAEPPVVEVVARDVEGADVADV